jgi:hypothetical protein
MSEEVSETIPEGFLEILLAARRKTDCTESC